MTAKPVAWVHPNPLLDDHVVLPDGYRIKRKEAEAKGFTVSSWPESERTATLHPHETDMVILSRGQVVSLDSAKSMGFTVSAPGPQAKVDPSRSWRSAIMGLPEARDRTSATAELLTTQSHETLSVEAARSFLRGLPTEQTQEQTAMTTDTKANPERAERLAQISANAKAFNKGRGYGARANAPAAQSRSASLASMDQTKLRRLAEIRLNALERGVASEASTSETKKLRYALTVEGMALSDVFAQLNLDTSKLRA
jgi:hypothetical protein